VPQDKQQPDKPAQGSELQYLTRVALDQVSMSIDGGDVALAPGMAVTVEIKTGRRRVLEYLLSPVLRYKQEGFRER
jgi:hemolysin D